MRKLLNKYLRKKWAEERASGIAPEQTELDALLEEVGSWKNDSELTVQQEITNKNRKLEQGIRTSKQDKRFAKNIWNFRYDIVTYVREKLVLNRKLKTWVRT